MFSGGRVAPVFVTFLVRFDCSGGGNTSPTSPSNVNPKVAADVTTATAGHAVSKNPAWLSDSFFSEATPDNIRPSAVTFPARNEPLAFRTALEAKYRDGLRRGPVATYVDAEGTVVWTQEYLRYRVNLCSHTDAVAKVMSQIDGLGISAACGSVDTAVFPPRNEPLAFMVALEAKYRDGIRRAAGESFVDVEGNIVWTQEYLRYRVSGCGHADSQQKVFDQIDGRGVQADCTPIVVAPRPPTPSPSPFPFPIPSPTPTPTPPSTNSCGGPPSVSCGTPTALCRDNTWSCSQNRSGTCSSHGGVSCWVCPGVLC